MLLALLQLQHSVPPNLNQIKTKIRQVSKKTQLINILVPTAKDQTLLVNKINFNRINLSQLQAKTLTQVVEVV